MAALAKFALSAILGSLLFIAVLALVAAMAVQPENVAGIVSGLDIAAALDDVGLTQYIASAVDGIANAGAAPGYSRAYGGGVGGAGGTDGSDLAAIEEKVRKLAGSERVKAALGDIADKYIEAAVAGDFRYHITSGEATAFVMSISPDIYDAFGFRISSGDYAAIAEQIELHVDLSDLSIESLVDNGGFGSGASDTMSAISDISTFPAILGKLLSKYPLAICAILCALFAFDILLLHRRKVRLAFLNAGIPALAAASAHIAAGLATGAAVGALSGRGLHAAALLAPGVLAMAQNYGLILAGVGTVLVILYAVIQAALDGRPPSMPKAAAAAGTAAPRPNGAPSPLSAASVAVLAALANAAAIVACGALLLRLMHI